MGGEEFNIRNSFTNRKEHKRSTHHVMFQPFVVVAVEQPVMLVDSVLETDWTSLDPTK